MNYGLSFLDYEDGITFFLVTLQMICWVDSLELSSQYCKMNFL